MIKKPWIFWWNAEINRFGYLQGSKNWIFIEFVQHRLFITDLKKKCAKKMLMMTPGDIDGTVCLFTLRFFVIFKLHISNVNWLWSMEDGAFYAVNCFASNFLSSFCCFWWILSKKMSICWAVLSADCSKYNIRKSSFITFRVDSHCSIILQACQSKQNNKSTKKLSWLKCTKKIGEKTGKNNSKSLNNWPLRLGLNVRIQNFRTKISETEKW